MTDTALEVKNLNVTINGNLILENINFELKAGSYLSIVGPNGSGKTTFLKTLIGLIKTSAGSLKLFDYNINEMPLDLIAYVPQIKTLDRSFPAIAIELVVSGLRKCWTWKINKEDKELALDILEKVSASDFAYKKLDELSGGELQRVYLARSLVRKPRILLLDEPATGIDLVCEMSINKIINDYNKNYGTTIIMVTHDWSAAYHHTNHVLMINKNQIYFGDSHNAFTELNLQKTFSQMGHKHGVTFGLKEN